MTVRSFLVSGGALLALAGRAAGGPAACTGDCGADGVVTVDEIVATVNLALNGGPTDACASADADGSGGVTVDEVVAAVSHALAGCFGGGDPTPTPTSAPPTPTATAEATPAGDIPTGEAQLEPWLLAGNYRGWRSESERHPSTGPHPVTVRTFVNDVLFDSLSAGNTQHPRGAAAVKELYNSSGNLRGFAVSLKVADDSAEGTGWYWYEKVGSSVFADGNGESICTGCHTFGADFILIPFPLE